MHADGCKEASGSCDRGLMNVLPARSLENLSESTESFASVFADGRCVQ